MKKLQQNGFAALEAILIVVVVCLVAGLGWWVYSQNKDTNTNQTNTSESSQGSRTKQQTGSTDLKIEEWNVKLTVKAADAIYKVQDNRVYLSTSAVENTAACKEVRETVPQYMQGIARHTALTDELHIQPAEAGQKPVKVQDALDTDVVKKVGDYYYEYFHGNAADCAPSSVDYAEAFKTLTAL